MNEAVKKLADLRKDYPALPLVFLFEGECVNTGKSAKALITDAEKKKVAVYDGQKFFDENSFKWAVFEKEAYDLYDKYGYNEELPDDYTCNQTAMVKIGEYLDQKAKKAFFNAIVLVMRQIVD